jgi:hypothetical protein
MTAMDIAAVSASVAALVLATRLFLSQNRIADQVRCRITLDFEPYRSVEIAVPLERQQEFLGQIQTYSKRWGLMFGEYQTLKGAIGNSHDFRVIQSCNRHFNCHIENIDEPERFRCHSMRSPRLWDDRVRPIFEDLIVRLEESGFEVSDMPEPSGEVAPA